MKNLPNQAPKENILIRFHYFLAKKQISGGFIAPFGPKTSKTAFEPRCDPLKMGKNDPNFPNQAVKYNIFIIFHNCLTKKDKKNINL